MRVPEGIVYENNPAADKLQLLEMELNKIAHEVRDMPADESFGFFIYDGDEIKGGIKGCIFYGSMYIQALWLHEDQRGLGHGKELMQAAESLAIDKGLNFITIDTMDWEAKDLYLKLGYGLEMARTGYLHDSTLYLLRKDLKHTTH